MRLDSLMPIIKGRELQGMASVKGFPEGEKNEQASKKETHEESK